MTSRLVKATLLVLSFFAIFTLVSSRAADLSTFAAADREAVRLYGTDQGHAYMVKFLDAMDQAVGQALRACLPGIPGRKKDIRFEIVFIVSAEGRIERMMRSTDSPSAVCFTRSIRPAAQLPRPPHDHWPIVSALTIGP
jgi:hypothetical protein